MQTIEIWSIALFGWLGFNILVFYIEKNKADSQDIHFNYRHFYETHWDNWAVTLFFAIPIVYYGPQIHYAIMHVFSMEYKWHDIFYAGPGIFVEFLVWAIKEINKKLS
jgi:hypothetical protein